MAEQTENGRFPTGATCTPHHAAVRLGVYTSRVYAWIAAGLLEGGCYRLEHRDRLVWWIDVKDLARFVEEGGRWAAPEKRRKRKKKAAEG